MDEIERERQARQARVRLKLLRAQENAVDYLVGVLESDSADPELKVLAAQGLLSGSVLEIEQTTAAIEQFTGTIHGRAEGLEEPDPDF